MRERIVVFVEMNPVTLEVEIPKPLDSPRRK
jgi:hypothetical protein